MATQSSYTTVKISRFGFPVLAVTFDRVATQDVKSVACALIADVCNADGSDYLHITKQWDLSLQEESKSKHFYVEGDGGDDYSCWFTHFDITEGDRRDAVHAARATERMFL